MERKMKEKLKGGKSLKTENSPPQLGYCYSKVLQANLDLRNSIFPFLT